MKYREKTYQITEYDGVEDFINESLNENVLIAAMSKEKPRKPKRDCSIKCGKNHINGSLFFCAPEAKRPQSLKMTMERQRRILASGI